MNMIISWMDSNHQRRFLLPTIKLLKLSTGDPFVMINSLIFFPPALPCSYIMLCFSSEAFTVVSRVKRSHVIFNDTYCVCFCRTSCPTSTRDSTWESWAVRLFFSFVPIDTLKMDRCSVLLASSSTSCSSVPVHVPSPFHS